MIPSLHKLPVTIDHSIQHRTLTINNHDQKYLMQSLSLLSILNKSAYLVFKKQTKGHFHALVLVNTLQINEKFNQFGKPTLVNLGNQFV